MPQKKTNFNVRRSAISITTRIQPRKVRERIRKQNAALKAKGRLKN